jgi:ribonuclease HI
MPKRESKSSSGAHANASPARGGKGPKSPPPDERPILVVTGSVGRGGPASGGWGYVICYPSGQELEAAGAVADTTVHRMALTAVIHALERVGAEETAPVRVVTSSQYTVDGASGKAERRSNLDLWDQLDGAIRGRRMLWEWEPDETMYLQERAAELAQLALKRAPRA